MSQLGRRWAVGGGPLPPTHPPRVTDRDDNPVTLPWADRDPVEPTASRPADPAEAPERTSSEHFRQRLATAEANGFARRFPRPTARPPEGAGG